MNIDEETREEIERKSRLYDAAKKRIVSRIQESVQLAVNKLKNAERELLDEVEAELGENPFAKLLESIDSGSRPTEARVKGILSREIPNEFGPDEDSFCSLYRGIEVFKFWRRKRDKCALTETLQHTQETVQPSAVAEEEEEDGQSEDISSLPDFAECAWKECPDTIEEKKRYYVDRENPRIATKTSNGWYCTILGDTPLPPGRVCSWNIRIRKSRDSSRYSTFVGIAPASIDQSGSYVYNNSGWHFYFDSSGLYSGPPHNYRNKTYGPKKEKGSEKAAIGDTVGVVMDTEKGDLSFVLAGTSYGTAFAGIPLDEPLVPCVILWYEGDSVELDAPEVKHDSEDKRAMAESKGTTAIATAQYGVPYVAMYDFDTQDKGLLSFKEGQIIYVTRMDAKWWEGRTVDGRSGWVPSNFVKKYNP